MNDIRTKTIAIDRRTSNVVKKCFEMYANGKHSMQGIADYLAENNITSVNNTRKSLEFVKNMLTNPFYRGVFTYDSETWEGKHKLFISQELFDKAQNTIMQRGHTQKKRYTWNSQTFSGLLRCGVCNQAIVGEHLIRKNRTNDKVREYTYYHCGRGNKKIKCTQHGSISEAKLEILISEQLNKYSMPADWANFILRKVEEDLSSVTQNQNKSANKQN